MSKIGNQKKYKPQRRLDGKDGLIGTDGLTKKTKNFLIKDLLGNMSLKEQMVGFFDPSKKNIYGILIPFAFTGTDFYEIRHNLNIERYISINFLDGTGTQHLKQMLTNNDIVVGYNGIGFDPSANTLSFGGDNINLNNQEGYLYLEYTKKNEVAGVFSEIEIETDELNLDVLGMRCITYTTTTNECDPNSTPITLISVLLKFEELICEHQQTIENLQLIIEELIPRIEALELCCENSYGYGSSKVDSLGTLGK